MSGWLGQAVDLGAVSVSAMLGVEITSTKKRNKVGASGRCSWLSI